MDIEDFMSKKLLKKGTTAKCFLLKNGNVFKQFNSPLDISDVERFKYFLNFENENILFPFDFVYDNKKFYGYVTKRAMGQTLSESFASSNLEKLSIHSIKTEKNIDLVSQGKIIMHDLHSDNVIYDGNLIQIIDPDEYGIRDIYTVEEIKDTNFKYYRTLISNLFIANIHGITNRHSDYLIDRINRYKYSGYRTSEIIIKIKDDMEKYTKEQIEIPNDFNRIIRK
ncbi:MAG: hypothetical protein IJE04_00850 [Bacilli bacterium]|nr:hypothetical protein [Bacilli bacterium]